MIEIKRWRRLIGVITISIIISLTNIVSVAASGNLLDGITEFETSESYAEDISYSVLRGNNLNYGSAKITRLSSNEINIYGVTQCHHECDDVYLYLYLERKVNGSYGTYDYWKFDKQNSSNLTVSMNVIVPRGYYYRVRGYHAAKDGSKESTTTLTSGILVR